MLPKNWTRRWPGCTSSALGVRLTELTDDQASYLGVDVQGPYKSDQYRYRIGASPLSTAELASTM